MPLTDLLHFFSPLVTNCRGFHQAWDAAPFPSAGDPLSGRWEGEWISEANGARGALRCVMVPSGPGRWQARFHATFARVLKACYDTEFEDHGAGLRGSSNLGTFSGGVYEYAGEVTDDHFVSTFQSRTDRGSFRMRRVR
jgi:hypothetical protein